jgi:hypothetical protein
MSAGKILQNEEGLIWYGVGCCEFFERCPPASLANK